jgi:hypothetical protein
MSREDLTYLLWLVQGGMLERATTMIEQELAKPEQVFGGMTDREAMTMALRILANKRLRTDEHLIPIVVDALRQALAQPEQEPKLTEAGADTNITRGLEPKGSGMVTLNQPDQKPVAWMLPEYGDVLSASEADGTGIYNVPLYTAPPKPEQESISTNDHLCAMLRQVHDVLACTALPMKRQWVGLTDEEIKEVLDLNVAPWSLSGVALQHVMDDARALEAKLKEKNNAV